MKIINASWEERNLGVTCCEVTIEKDDSLSYVEDELSRLSSVQSLVIKVDAPNVEAHLLLAKLGYTFIEANMNMFLDVRNYRLSALEQRFNSQIHYRKLMEKEELERFEAELDKGLFNTDRIYLDPNFTKEQSANRYKYWIRDEISRGAELFEIVYKESAIGFFIQKQLDEKTYYPFLAGLYIGNQEKIGLGFSVLAKPIEDVIQRGGKYISTYVSSNNLSIVKLHAQLGFLPNKIYNVFVKHNSKI